MKKQISKWYSVLSPRPTVLVGTINKKGISNAAPFSFVMPVSMNPPLVAFASVRTRHTLKNIREVGDFTVNIPSSSLLKKVWACADSLPEDVSEIDKAGLTEAKSEKIKSPKIKECFARFECKLRSEHNAGDHIVVIGEIVKIEVDGKAEPLMHIGSNVFAVPGKKLTV